MSRYNLIHKKLSIQPFNLPVKCSNINVRTRKDVELSKRVFASSVLLHVLLQCESNKAIFVYLLSFAPILFPSASCSFIVHTLSNERQTALGHSHIVVDKVCLIEGSSQFKEVFGRVRAHRLSSGFGNKGGKNFRNCRK